MWKFFQTPWLARVLRSWPLRALVGHLDTGQLSSSSESSSFASSSSSSSSSSVSSSSSSSSVTSSVTSSASSFASSSSFVSSSSSSSSVTSSLSSSSTSYVQEWSSSSISSSTSSLSSVSEQSSSSTEPNPDIYRFHGYRYGFRGPSYHYSNQMIPEIPSLYAFPREDTVVNHYTNSPKAKSKNKKAKKEFKKDRHVTSLIPILRQKKKK